MLRTILLGPPGAGKGTQAQMIVEKYDVPHISTGDIFRDNIKRGTELGKKAQEYMNKGELVPDDVTINMMIDKLSSDECNDGYILDGFPRTIPQAEALDYATALRSMTQAKGSFTMEFSKYQQVPQLNAEKIIAAHKAEEEAENK